MATVQELYAAQVQAQYQSVGNSIGGVGKGNWIYYQCGEGSGSLTDTSGRALDPSSNPSGSFTASATTAGGFPTYGNAGPFSDGSAKSVRISASGAACGFKSSHASVSTTDACYGNDFWLKVHSLPPAGQITELTRGFNYSILLLDTGVMRMLAQGIGFGSVLSTNVSDGAWHYCAWQRVGDGTGDVHVYVDGVLDATDPAMSNSIASPANDCHIGWTNNAFTADIELSNVAWYFDICPFTLNYPPPVSSAVQLPYLMVGP